VSDIHKLNVSFYLKPTEVAGEDNFKEPAEVRTFNVASDVCRAALVEALEGEGKE
jgi:hypothetical protein